MPHPGKMVKSKWDVGNKMRKRRAEDEREGPAFPRSKSHEGDNEAAVERGFRESMAVATVVGGVVHVRVGEYERRRAHRQDADGVFWDSSGRNGTKPKGLSECSGQVGRLLAEARPHSFAWASRESGAVVPDDGGMGGADIGIVTPQSVAESNAGLGIVWEVDAIEAN